MNPLGLIAILAGGYMLYRYYGPHAAGGGGTPSTGGGSTTTGGGGSSTTTGGGSSTSGGGSSTTGGGSTTQQTLPLAAATPLAAAGDVEWAQALTDRGVVYSVDEWNYFRVQGGRPAIDPGEMPILVHDDEVGMRITANEYLQRLARLSVSTWHTT